MRSVQLFQKGVPMEKPKNNTVRVIAFCTLAFCLCTRTVLALENTFDEAEENIEETSGTSEPFAEEAEEEITEETEPSETGGPSAETAEEQPSETEDEIVSEEAAEKIPEQPSQTGIVDEPDANEPIIKINSATSGIIIIEGKTYYYNPVSHEKTTGAVIIDAQGYYFGADGNMVRNTWIDRGSSGWSYYGADGKQYVSKWATLIDEDGTKEHTYYFTQSGCRAEGTVNISGSSVAFDANGVIRSLNQLISIGGQGYFFDGSGVMLKNGWKYIDAKGWAYFGADGRQYKSRWADLADENGRNENRYYFSKNGYRVLGMNTISQTKYYFSESTGALVRDQFVKTGGHTVYITSEGKLALNSFNKNGTHYAVSPNSGYIMRGPDSFYYYSQKDSRWSGLRYGYWSFGGTGCVPTSVAMALSSLKGYAITPVDVGDYLYYNTTTFNYGSDLGTSGSGNKYAAAHWDINCENIDSLSDLRSVLSDGMIVGVLVNPGTFCPAGYTHEVVLYGYSEGSVHVYDPLANATTGWYPVSTVWNQLSTDPMDLDAGTPVYVFFAD